MQRGFAEAVLNESHRVFGYRLEPFSAAHIFTLEAAKAAVIRGGEKITPEDLLMAAKICACRVRLVNGSYQPAGKWWKVTQADRFKVAWAQDGTGAFRRQCEAFAAYLGDFTETPAKMEKSQSSPNIGRTFSCPSVMAIVMRGIALVGEERAWSMPFGLLKTMLEVKSEIDGGSVRFQPDEDEAAQIQEQLAEAERRGRELLKERGLV